MLLTASSFATLGVMVALSPLAAAGFSIGLVLVTLTASRRLAVTVFCGALVGVLLGYALMGRGFAYLGAAPIYVGEVALGLGVIAAITKWRIRPIAAVHILLVAFMAWGAARTLPYAAEYGFDAFRDAASWGYGLFALLVWHVVDQRHVERLKDVYRKFVWLLIIWIPVLAVVWFSAQTSFPRVPGTNVPIPFFKGGDMAVHLTGAAAFGLSGLLGTRTSLIREPLFWVIWLAGFTSVAALNRGGMLAMLVAVPTVLLFVRRTRVWIAPVFVAAVLVAALSVMNANFGVIGKDRQLSVGQLVQNSLSIIGESEDDRLAGTREWRVRWWDTIVNYTVFGDRFWNGKGYGINLAEDDGFIGRDPSLRSPHNAHLQFLARGGVPGLVLWISVQLAFAFAMLRSAWSNSKARRSEWAALQGWIFAYWAAALINMTFDVYLEGPQGGILFWSLVGLGLATITLSKPGGAASEGRTASSIGFAEDR